MQVMHDTLKGVKYLRLTQMTDVSLRTRAGNRVNVRRSRRACCAARL